MEKLVQTLGLCFDDKKLSLYISSGEKVYVHLSDLCGFLGVDWKKYHQYTLEDTFLYDKLAIFSVDHNNRAIAKRKDTFFINATVIPYWLIFAYRRTKGKNTRKHMRRLALEHREFFRMLMEERLKEVENDIPAPADTPKANHFSNN